MGAAEGPISPSDRSKRKAKRADREKYAEIEREIQRLEDNIIMSDIYSRIEVSEDIEKILVDRGARKPKRNQFRKRLEEVRDLEKDMIYI